MSAPRHQPWKVGTSWVENDATAPRGRRDERGGPGGADRELDHRGAPDPVALHRTADGRVDGAEVLADDRRAVALRLDGDDGEQLLERHPHVDAVARGHPVGHAEQTLGAEHVVDPQHARHREVMDERRSEEPVAGAARGLDARGREAPYLPSREEAVRRRADGQPVEELVAMAPHVVAVGMHPEGEVEREDLASTIEPLGEGVELRVGEPLDDLVVARHRRVHVARLDPPRSQGLRPAPPVEPMVLAGGAEPRPVAHLGSLGEERVEGRTLRRAGLAEAGGDLGEHAALGPQRTLAVDVGMRGGGRGPGSARTPRARALRDRGPEASTTASASSQRSCQKSRLAGHVGARLEGRRAEAGEQRQRGDDGRAVGCGRAPPACRGPAGRRSPSSAPSAA